MSRVYDEYFTCGVCLKKDFREVFMTTECELCHNNQYFIYKIGELKTV